MIKKTDATNIWISKTSESALGKEADKETY